MTVDLLDAITTDGGFTYSVRNDALVRIGEATGYVVAIPGTEMLLGPATMTRGDFAQRFAALVQTAATADYPIYVGGWLSPERGYMIELSEILHVERETAIQLGIWRNQEAILDIATGEFIATGGTGDA